MSLLLWFSILFQVNKKEVKKVITFSPSVFTIPENTVDKNLVSVMMPFAMEFDKVLETVKAACFNVGMICYRVDDIWNNSIIIQDIFELICRSSIVIVDFSHRNPNVFYEAGIAHTLGKNVIPIAQSIEDVPFDLRHHRVLNYLKNKPYTLRDKGVYIRSGSTNRIANRMELDEFYEKKKNAGLDFHRGYF